MSNRRPRVCALALLCALQPAVAQDARIITYEQALSIALERNSMLREAEIAADASALAVEQARARFLPDVSLSSRGAQSFGRNFNEAEGRVIDTSTRTVNLGLSSSITLFDGYANIAGLREARYSAQASHLDLRRTREAVVFTVASNFLGLLQQQEELHVRRESLAAESALEQQIAIYVDAGARTVADLYQQQAAVASARLAVVEAERAALLAEVDLLETLQLDPAANYQFESPPLDASLVAREVPDLKAMLSSAYAQRVDLQAAENRVKASEEAVRVARADKWPTVSLTNGYATSFTSASDFGVTDQFDQRRGGSVTLAFSVPIFDRGSARIATRRAQLNADSARLALETRRKEVGLDVRRAYLDFRAAREQLSSADSQLKAADLALLAAQERYQTGAATFVELSQARAVQVQAASALVRAKSNLLFQTTLVDYYMGELELPAGQATGST